MSLVVRLAGYNLDADLVEAVLGILRDLDHVSSAAAFGNLTANDYKELLESVAGKVRSNINPEAFTPETISAAYARISRDPKAVTELRKAARFAVTRARKSNENIIFGLGHASVAEHACFNFDILGLSRLASEELQSHRLVSFTEKSQRYISLTTDYVIPPELLGTPWEERLNQLIPKLFAGYQELSENLQNRYLEELGHEPNKDEMRDIENRAKEDARYLLPLACSTQMGVTMNARNIEHITCDLSDHPLQELCDLGQGIVKAVGGLAPSLIKYTTRGSYPRGNREQLRATEVSHDLRFRTHPQVRLIDRTPDGEVKVLNALAYTLGRKELRNDVNTWREIYRDMSPHDGVLREFEVAQMTFEGEISASCFAQLKRHRMMTLLHQPYCVEDAVMVPPSVEEAGLAHVFKNTITSVLEAARGLLKESPLLAPYLLTNAHIKHVRIQINARELYHFARLRSDHHAQWEARELSDQMLALAREHWPNLLALAVG
ncbi:MAG: FAD-dependent thymidylate synthase, partial [Calditrichota bacterium]